jgi:hypothetical protein
MSDSIDATTPLPTLDLERVVFHALARFSIADVQELVREIESRMAANDND